MSFYAFGRASKVIIFLGLMTVHNSQSESEEWICEHVEFSNVRVACYQSQKNRSLQNWDTQ